MTEEGPEIQLIRSTRMRFGIHLPQYGRVASAEAITEAARRAEELGFDDVWVSDHVIAARRAGLPLAVPVRPADDAGVGRGGHHDDRPRHERARGAAVPPARGWPTRLVARRAERRPAHARRRRRLERGRVRRARPALPHPRPAHRRDPRHPRRPAGATDPTSFARRVLRRSPTSGCCRSRPTPIDDLDRRWQRAPPTAGRPPRRRLPAHRPRQPDTVAEPIARLRRDHPDPTTFTISLRTGWDPLGMDPDRIRRERDEFEAAGRPARGRRRRGAPTSTTGSGRWSCWRDPRATRRRVRRGVTPARRLRARPRRACRGTRCRRHIRDPVRS